MYLLPIYFCLYSFLLSLIFGKHLSSKGSIFFNILSLFYSLLFSIFIFYEVFFLHVTCYIHLMPWIQLGYVDIYWSLLFDTLSCTMLLVILLVSFFANVYSVEYMFYEPHKIRFFAYLSLFTFTMIILVTSNTLIQLFFGWECVGISSYLLINFWYTRIQANKSSILAIMANKIGDILLLFCFIFICFLYNSLFFNVIFLCCDYYVHYINTVYNSILNINIIGYVLYNTENLIFLLYDTNIFNINNYNNYHVVVYSATFICGFIIFASICKSAQAGFHFWLSEAMEGPTPVSSLLHAATMVTAGVFLTIRCSFLFNNASYIPIYIICIGSITSFFASLIGITQNDLKKIVAYSTCSQLGYMFVSNGIFSYNVTMFHLLNHAFFKALLFLTSGYVIHIMSNEQDLRRMGGLIKILPLPYMCLCIGSISLMGIPYLSGFFSKDIIIESFYSITISADLNIKYYTVIFYSQIFLSISVIFTILYSVKLIYYIFLNASYNGSYNNIVHIHFSSLFIIIPLLLLSILSITSGFFFSDYMIGSGSTFWNNSINMCLYYYDKYIPMLYSDEHIMGMYFCLLPYAYNKLTYYLIIINTVYFTIVLYILFKYYYFYIYVFFLGIIHWSNLLYVNINKKFLFFNRLIVNSIVKNFFKESYNSTYKLVDKQLFEVLGPFGIIFNIKYYLQSTNKLSTGLIYHYSGVIIVSIIFCIYYFL